MTRSLIALTVKELALKIATDQISKLNWEDYHNNVTLENDILYIFAFAEKSAKLLIKMTTPEAKSETNPT